MQQCREKIKTSRNGIFLSYVVYDPDNKHPTAFLMLPWTFKHFGKPEVGGIPILLLEEGAQLPSMRI